MAASDAGVAAITPLARRKYSVRPYLLLPQRHVEEEFFIMPYLYNYALAAGDSSQGYTMDQRRNDKAKMPPATRLGLTSF